MTSDARIDRLEGVVPEMGNRLASMENSIQGLRSEMNSRFSEVNSRLNTLTVVVFGNVATTVLTAVGIIVAVLITR